MKLVADANVLLSAVIGGRAAAVFDSPSVEEIFTAEATYAEVRRYVEHLAERRKLSVRAALLTTATLPVKIVARPAYESMLAEANRQIGDRDPDDVDLLALALTLDAPIWSNDRDFEDARVRIFTTAQLLRELEASG